MTTPLLLALMLIQDPTSVAQVDEASPVSLPNPVPVLARGILVQSDLAWAAIAAGSGGPLAVPPAPCAYYTYIAGAAYCSARALSNGTIMGLSREDYLLWRVQQDIAAEMTIRVRAAVRANEARRLEAQRAQPAPAGPSAAAASRASGNTAAQPRSAGATSNFSGGMYTPAPQSSAGGAKTGSSPPAKRGDLK